MTRSEIDSLRQDSKAAMKLASDLVAKNIEPLNFANTYFSDPKNQVYLGPAMYILTVFVNPVPNVLFLKDVDSPQKGKYLHPKAG